MIKANKGLVEMRGTPIELVAEIGTCCRSIIGKENDIEIKQSLLATVILSLYGEEEMESHFEKVKKLTKFIDYKMKEGESDE